MSLANSAVRVVFPSGRGQDFPRCYAWDLKKLFEFWESIPPRSQQLLNGCEEIYDEADLRDNTKFPAPLTLTLVVIRDNPDIVKLLHNAATTGNLEHFNGGLVDNPDMVAYVDEKGRTILHVAVLKQNVEFVDQIVRTITPTKWQQLLVAKDRDGNTPMKLAQMNEDFIMAEHLDKDDGGRSALFLAAQARSTRHVKKLLRQATEEMKSEVAEFAYAKGYPDIFLEVVVSVHPKAVLQNSDEPAPHQIVLCDERDEVLQWVLRISTKEKTSGCGFPHLKDAEKDDRTALHLAAENNYAKSCHLLLSLCPDESSRMTLQREKDRNGYTALDLAARCGHAEVCGVLVEEANSDFVFSKHGESLTQSPCALLQMPSRDGKMSLHHAIEGGSGNVVDIIKVLLKFNTEEEQLLVWKQQTDETVAGDGGGNTAVHLAANRNLETVLELLVKKCKENQEIPDWENLWRTLNGKKMTPLILATKNNRVKSAKVLVSAPKEPFDVWKMRDIDECTAVHYAVLHEEMLDVFLRHVGSGTDKLVTDEEFLEIISAKNNEGLTPYNLAQGSCRRRLDEWRVLSGLVENDG